MNGDVASALPTVVVMPMAPMGSTSLPGPGLRTVFSTPAWSWREMQGTDKAGKAFSSLLGWGHLSGASLTDSTKLFPS